MPLISGVKGQSLPRLRHVKISMFPSPSSSAAPGEKRQSL